MSKFVHLRTHTGFSMSDGIIKANEVLEAAKLDGMPALAITDIGNIMSSVNFYKSARKTGVKPIIGIDMFIENTDQDSKEEVSYHKMTFLVQNETGYHNLNKIISRAYIENKKEEGAIIKKEWLDTMKVDGVIALSGATEGPIGSLLAKNKLEKAEKEAEWFKSIFGDSFFIELQRDGRLGQEDYIGKAVNLASKVEIPVVATHMNQFLKADDYDAHDIRVVIADGGRIDNPSRKIRFTREQYFKNTEEMIDLFQDIPSAIENTVRIAEKCNQELNIGHPELPSFGTQEGETENEALIRLSKDGLNKRLELIFPDATERKEKRKEYDDRLDVELGVINQMKFPGYFLIVQDFINWAKEQDIPVGPGRGSGAGSLVAYSLRITDIDPLPYKLLFERFLNPERVSMPDFDIDFCRNRRDEIFDYIKERHGVNNVAQIATVGTMTSKAVIKDVGRVMGMLPFATQELTDLIPVEQGEPMGLSQVIKEVPRIKELYDTESEIRRLFDLGIKLENTPRQFGMHAAGVVIAPRDITQFTPLYYDGKGVTSHFDKKDVEEMGLVKFDILGLDTLTTIHKAVSMIKKLPGSEDFDIAKIKLDDEVVFDLIRKGNTTAVFQLEGHGMKGTEVKLQPSCFEDILALVALFRPGPLKSGMVNEFISRKHGLSAVEYPHPKLEEILKPTYGIVVYQEQVMQIAQELAGYSLGGADILRRAMGKKDAAEMATQRDVFTQGAVKNGVDLDVATKVFDLMEKFAEYGFNKSHSAAYGLISYQTAYLKGKFPLQLYAAAMASKAEDGQFERVADLVSDARKNGYNVLPPDINESDFAFKAEGKKNIRFGFSGIKSVGESAALVIQAEREKNGKYKDIFDVFARIGKGSVNKRVREALINAGAFDSFGFSRETLMENADKLQAYATECSTPKKKKGAKNETASVFDEIEGMSIDKKEEDRPVPPELTPAKAEWSMLERLAREFKVFDFYFSGHPYDAHKQELSGLNGIVEIQDLTPSSGALYTAGVIKSYFERKSAAGNMWVSLVLENNDGEVGVTVFGDTYQAVKHKIKEGNFVVIGGKTKDELFNEKVQINADYLLNKEEARTLTSQFVKVAIENEKDYGQKIMEVLDRAPKNDGPISSRVIVYSKESGKPVKTEMGDPYTIVLTDEFMKDIIDVAGSNNVKLHPRTELAPPYIEDRRKSFGKRRK